jgi:hypothetical protein
VYGCFGKIEKAGTCCIFARLKTSYIRSRLGRRQRFFNPAQAVADAYREGLAAGLDILDILATVTGYRHRSPINSSVAADARTRERKSER